MDKRAEFALYFEMPKFGSGIIITRQVRKWSEPLGKIINYTNTSGFSDRFFL